MPSRRDDRAGEPSAPAWPGEFPGTEEVPVLDWPDLWRERIGRRLRDHEPSPAWVLVAALVGLFASGFTITVLAVSVKQIAADLDTTTTSLTWIVSGPLLMLALAMPLFGKLGDVWGHRRLYLVGFSVFALFTGLCALAWSAPSLIVLRVLAAAGGAATGPASMALIMQAYRVEDRVKAMGWWSLVGAGAPVIGVVVGGPLVAQVGWRWIFVAQVPVSLLALLLAAVVLKETPRRPPEAIDVRGALLLAVATVSALLALDRGAAWGFARPAVVGLAALAPVALWAFVRAEHRAAAPLLPLEFFGRRNFSAGLVAQFGSNFAYMGGFIITPLLMQDQFGYSLEATGLVMLLRPLTFSLFAPIAGYLTVRIGERTAAVAGTVSVVVSMGVFALAAGTSTVWLVPAGLVLSGLGLGASSPSLVSSVANSVGENDLGVVNAAQSMVAQIGVVAGIQLLSAIVGVEAPASAFVAAYLVGAAVAATAVAGAGMVRSAARAAPLTVVRAA